MKNNETKSVIETIVKEFGNLSPAEEHSILQSNDFEFVKRQIQNLQKEKNVFVITSIIIIALAVILVVFFFRDKPISEWFYLIYVLIAVIFSIKASFSYANMKKKISLFKILKSYYDNKTIVE